MNRQIFTAFSILLASWSGACGSLDLKNMADEQIAAVKGRILIDGKIHEPLYEMTVGNPNLKYPDDCVVYVSKIRVFPPARTVARKSAEQYVNELKKEIADGKFIIISTDSAYRDTREITVYQQLKLILASAKSDKEKTNEITGIVNSQLLAEKIVKNNK